MSSTARVVTSGSVPASPAVPGSGRRTEATVAAPRRDLVLVVGGESAERRASSVAIASSLARAKWPRDSRQQTKRPRWSSTE